jgi:hypothetical protein
MRAPSIFVGADAGAAAGAGAALVEVDAVRSEQAEPSNASSAAAPAAEMFFIESPR